MNIQEQIATAIVRGIEEVGGDVSKATAAAMQCRNVEQWIQQETTKVAISGGAEMAIPGLHSLTIPLGITFLLHKIAHLSWGIGALKGAYVIETEEYSDLRNILAVWANDNNINATMMEHLSINMDTFLHSLSDDGYATLSKTITQAEEAGIDNVIVNSMHVLKMLGDDFAEDEVAIRMVTSVAGDEASDRAIQASVQRSSDRSNTAIIDKQLGTKISMRLALRLAEKLGVRFPAKFIMGFVPIAGVIANAFLNAQTLRGMAQAAEKYYDKPFTRADLENLM